MPTLRFSAFRFTQLFRKVSVLVIKNGNMSQNCYNRNVFPDTLSFNKKLDRVDSIKKTGLVDFHTEIGIILFAVICILLTLLRKNEKKSLVKRRTSVSRFRITRFEDIPGPSCWPIVGLLHHLARPNLDIFGLALEWFEEYRRYGLAKGHIFYRHYVGLLKPSYIQTVLSSTKPSVLSKPAPYKFMHAIANGLIVADYPVWQIHRKIISRLFTYNGVQHQIQKINFHTKNLIRKFLNRDDKENQKEGADVFHSIVDSALYNILDVIVDMEVASPEERHQLHTNLSTVKNGMAKRIREPWLLIPPIWWFHPLRKKMQRGEREIKNLISKMKIAYQQSGKSGVSNNSDFTTAKRLKPIMEEMLDAGLNEEDIFQETLTMIIAGNDTSSWLTSFLLLRLALNPEIQKKCREEIDQLFETKFKNKELNVTSSLDCELSVLDLNGLEYLERCAKETLRLTPIVPIFARRLEESLKLDNHLELPAGTTVVIPPWLIHRNPDVFPETEVFDPDRFLPDETQMRHPYSYLPFSAGVRNCLGFKVAPLAIKLVTAFILRHFEVETRNKFEEFEFQFDITVTTKQDINLMLKRRPNII